jgi:hypothetical protein
MKERWLIHLLWTGISTPLLIILGFYLMNTNAEWLRIPFVMPGVTLCTWLGGMDGHMPDFFLFLLSEIICNWALLIVGVATIEFLHNRKSVHA